MANLPETISKEGSPALDAAGIRIADGLIRGLTPFDLAKRVYPHDRAGQKRLKRQIERRILNDPQIVARVHQAAMINMVVGIGPATRALGRKAAAGRMDAIKLLLEATGVHNPRVKHEHSGDIKISLDMPRPTFDQPRPTSEPIVDAEIVD